MRIFSPKVFLSYEAVEKKHFINRQARMLVLLSNEIKVGQTSLFDLRFARLLLFQQTEMKTNPNNNFIYVKYLFIIIFILCSSTGFEIYSLQPIDSILFLSVLNA